MVKLKLQSIVKAILPSISVLAFWGIPLFLIAGTLFYWNAWLFILTVAIAWGIIQLYLVKNDQSLFEKRLKKTEKNITANNIATMLCIIIVRNYYIRF
jgi:hypothetical protein